jgi:outer membrane protein assembly factor BamD
MFVSPRAIAALAVGASLLLLPACASNRPGGGLFGGSGKKELAYVARDVETLYTIARDTLDRGQYRTAALMFDEVERQHPYSVWARRAQLMAAFSYYAARQYPEAVLAAQRFLSLHPGNRDAPYAYYIIAMSYYEQIADVSRDQRITAQAQQSLDELVRRYPDTPYAQDARVKLDLVNDHLAGKEMAVGRFYSRSRQWIAATRRYQAVIDNYQNTSHVPEALHRLTEAYLALGMPEEARRAAAVLGHNFPGSKWYERAFALVQQHAPA